MHYSRMCTAHSIRWDGGLPDQPPWMHTPLDADPLLDADPHLDADPPGCRAPPPLDADPPTWADKHLGHACFPKFLQNFSECQILWSLCSVVFHALQLKLPIQTPLSVMPKLQVCVLSGEKCKNFRKTSTPL